MPNHKVVTQKEWVRARMALLEKEKEFDKKRDALSAERRELPWVRVEKDYTFVGPNGNVRLADLFDGRKQLIVYHFMFDPDWDEGCPACSHVADNFERAVVHLNQREVTLVAVSQAPIDKLERFKKRLGWTFLWVSSGANDFNYDFQVSATAEEKAAGKFAYNYNRTHDGTQGPGVSVFFKDEAGNIFHTYSTFGRGLDILLGTYNYLDLAPFGRNEDGIKPHPMAWVRHRDRYSQAIPVAIETRR